MARYVKDYIYKIHDKKTNKTYIGQNVSYSGDRLKEHFRKTLKEEKTEAGDVINSALWSDLEITVYEAPNYGLDKQNIMDFLSYFWFAGGRFDRKSVNVAAREQSVLFEGLEDEDLNKTFSQLTRGNIADVAEILHTANAISCGENVVNRDMGGQQTSWFINGTTTRAFKKSDSPRKVYETILSARHAPIGVLQEIADSITSEWFKETKWSDLVWEKSDFNSKTVAGITDEFLTDYINNPDGGKSLVSILKKKMIKELGKRGYSTNIKSFGLKWRTTQKINKSIHELVIDVVKHQIKSLNKKTVTLNDLLHILNRNLKFQSTGKPITIPITMLFTLDADIEKENLKWWVIKEEKQKIIISPDQIKEWSFQRFQKIYNKIHTKDFYVSRQNSEAFHDIGQLGELSFQKYYYNGPKETLSYRMKEEYINLGLTQYADPTIWHQFYSNMIALIVKDFWTSTTTDAGKEVWYIDGLFLNRKPIEGSDGKKYVVASYFTNGVPPSQSHGLKNIKIY